MKKMEVEKRLEKVKNDIGCQQTTSELVCREKNELDRPDSNIEYINDVNEQI